MFAQGKIKKRLFRQVAIHIINLAAVAGSLKGQTNRLFVPFLDEESQSNVLVIRQGEQPCPTQYANTILNTNLFELNEQKLIESLFAKYKNVTTNFGPAGTVLVDLHKTNYTVKIADRTVEVENWLAKFRYTNFEAFEEIRFKPGILANFRDKSNDGYSVSFARTGGGTLLSFWEVKHGLSSGLLARFTDRYPQGGAWDFRRARFSTNSPLTEYRQYTNGLVFGRFLVWNPRNNNLLLEADFKEPYDFEKHRIDLRRAAEIRSRR